MTALQEQARPHASQAVFVAMSIACGLAVANLYYNQPLLRLLETDFPSAHTGVIAPITQIGYAIGLLFLVPLGDLLPRRSLIVGQFLALSATSAMVGLAPNMAYLLAGSFTLGFVATVAQQIIPVASELSPDGRRGQVMGKVMSGLLCGILLSRTFSGYVGEHFGWRTVFILGSPLALIAAMLMLSTIPSPVVRNKTTYRELWISMLGLWRGHQKLRLACIGQALLFGSFSIFWSVLAFHLAEPTFGLGPNVAGLFGLVGVMGAIAAPLAGRANDRYGPRLPILVGTFGMAAAWIVLGLWHTLAGMIIGVMILDLAYHSTVVPAQQGVYAIMPTARSRINTLFVGSIFVGGSAGSAVAAAAWEFGGWTAVSLAGLVFAGLSLLTASKLHM